MAVTVISDVVRYTVGSNACWLGMVNSPLRKNPKNPKQLAAHSIISLNMRGVASNAVQIALRVREVIGRQIRARLARSLHTPFKTKSSISLSISGSSWPRVILKVTDPGLIRADRGMADPLRLRQFCYPVDE